MQCGNPQTVAFSTTGSQVRPCGQCMSCRINHRRARTLRILMEWKLHDQACFGTLTYDEEHVPRRVASDGAPVDSLRARDCTLWLKRMRVRADGFRYFLVGEYGGKTHRPHYHPILFGMHADEAEERSRKHWAKSAPERVQFEPMTVEWAAYAAGYTVKKMTRQGDPRLDPAQEPEFTRSSMGLGEGFILDQLAELQARPAAMAQLQETGDVMKSVTLFGRSWPLDRYTRERLREWFGVLPAMNRPTVKFRTAEEISAQRKNLARLERLATRKGARVEAQRRQAGIPSGAPGGAGQGDGPTFEADPLDLAQRLPAPRSP